MPPIRRISGKDGAIWLQVGNTAVSGPDSCDGNSAAEVVNGISYEAYQVWTLSESGNIPMDPGTYPTVVVGGTGLPAAYTYEWLPLLGKLIFTPSLGSGATVSMSAYATPKLYQQGDIADFGIDVEQEMQDASAMGQNWKGNVVGLHGWSGSATVHFKSSTFWDASAGVPSDVPKILRFYPRRSVDEYWWGMGFLNWGIKVDKGSVVSQSISLTGDDGLYFKEAS